MRTLTVLTSKDEKLVNKLIRSKRKASYILLYCSEWDKWSEKILSLAAEWASRNGGETCYVISSWELPHAFSAFGISEAPAVVKVDMGNIKVLVEYPRVVDFFAPSAKRASRKSRRV